ncbi:PH, RCC1 and FYVE domains-containing protein 1, partial [Mucuna pruriens]
MDTMFPCHFFIWECGTYRNPKHDIQQALFERFFLPERNYMSFSLVYKRNISLSHLFTITSFCFCEVRDCELHILISKPIFDYIQNATTLKLTLGNVSVKYFIDSISNKSSLYFASSYMVLECANMHSRLSVGDGFQLSASTAPKNSSVGYELDELDSFQDIYIWGEVLTNGVSHDRIGTLIPSKTDILIPKPIESNAVFDVHHFATGAHHIAIVTRQGQVFTWGEESGGRLGHGTDKDFGHPILVEFLEGTCLDFVTCGEYHTGAISKSYELYMWGDGTHNVGLLGQGSDASHWIPKIVNGPLEGLHVVSVACGTWHSALTTSTGQLFTFGDGAFGVLGHGDQESVWYPKEVELLSGLKTIKVACGVWHTAAIIEVAFQSSSNTPSWKLFTWGDGDKYRLGHGNKETYLQPTRVTSLIEYNFHQVACGHTMTIALTTSGHVFTMGDRENGQLGNPMSIGKIPTLVQDKLLGEFVEEISCGARHVAILTKKSELYTWGMGANGRLGHGDIEDRKSPTLVVALKDRNIKHISCGFNFTSCTCIHKWISGTDQSICFGCRQVFGLTRKRHNCHNCGLLFCHACSSKKTLKAALTPTPEKLHRVCDNCYVKLKVVDDGASKLDRKATPSHYSINGNERSGQGATKSTRTLLSPITEPVKYLEIKNRNPGRNDDSTSFVRSSQVPSLVQLKDIAFPSSLSSSQSVIRTITPLSPSQTLPLPTNSTPLSTHIRRQSPPRTASPRFFGTLNNSLRRKNDLLNQEVSKLQKQIQSLKQRSDMQEVEIKKLNKKAMEATALAAVEYSNHRVTKEFVESTIHQLKEITKKLPQEIPESENLITVLTRAEDFLEETLESETSSPSKLESKQQNALDTPTLDGGFSKLQKNKLKRNVDVIRVRPCQDEEKILQESNKSKLEPKQQNAPNIPTLGSNSSKLKKSKVEENVDVARVDPCQDEGNFLEESNKLKLEPKQQNAPDISTSDNDSSKLQKKILEENVNATTYEDEEAFVEESNKSKLESRQQKSPNIPTSDTRTSKMQDHELEKNVNSIEVDLYQVRENLLEKSNGPKLEIECKNEPNMFASIHDVSKLLEDRLEDNDKAGGVYQSQVKGHILQECHGSSISSVGATNSSQNSKNDSKPLDSSRIGKQGEIQVIEKFEHGVYVALMLRSDGIKMFKQVKFSKRRFTANQAEEWWNQNKGRVLRYYCPTHQKLTIRPSSATSHVTEMIEASPS